LLEAEGISRYFGGVKAVDGVDLKIEAGSITGLIGPNGAGKTTFVNILTGYVRPQAGRIRLEGNDITGRSPHEMASLGVARTFQTIRLFRDMTVLENVQAGMHLRRPDDLLAHLLPLPALRGEARRAAAEARELLRRVGLNPEVVGAARASQLSYGDQRRVEIARALALQPKLLVLDEPVAGMNPSEKGRMRDLIARLPDHGVTVLMIEHDMRLVMGVCDHIAVLNFGRRIASGTPAEIGANPEVITAYLGADSERTARPAGTSLGTSSLLKVTDLDVSYGGVQAVAQASFEVGEGELVALIGPNGAGKTTILNTLSGLLRPDRGSIEFAGHAITGAPSHRIVRSGLIHVPEGREVLARQTVRENLELGAFTRRDRHAIRAQVDELLTRFPILRERASLPAGQLSGGEQQILAIARGLMARPRLLLLDEPSLGLAPLMVDQVFRIIDEIRTDGTTVLLVEQNARRALQAADRAYVLESGRVVLSGSGAELLEDPRVRATYLGA